jgi:hypothetical protein
MIPVVLETTDFSVLNKLDGHFQSTLRDPCMVILFTPRKHILGVDIEKLRFDSRQEQEFY